MGWLYAPQDKQDGKTRASVYGDKHAICKLPDCDKVVLKHFRSVGPCLNIGMGNFPVTSTELSNYKSLVAPWLTIWEAEQILMMSQQYCHYLNKAKEASCPPPYEREFTDEDIAESNKAITAMLEAEERSFEKLKAQN